MTKWLFTFLFIARVTIPMGAKYTYENVDRVEGWLEGSYRLFLTDGRLVIVPIMWTVLEEVK